MCFCIWIREVYIQSVTVSIENYYYLQLSFAYFVQIVGCLNKCDLYLDGYRVVIRPLFQAGNLAAQI